MVQFIAASDGNKIHQMGAQPLIVVDLKLQGQSLRPQQLSIVTYTIWLVDKQLGVNSNDRPLQLKQWL